jgi:hypothetical protein
MEQVNQIIENMLRACVLTDDPKWDKRLPLSGSTASKTSLGSGGSNGSGGSGQRVVRKIGVGSANWPLLTKTNYTEWALIMKIKLQARNLWEAIEPGDVTLQEDRMALYVITSAAAA